MMGLLNFLNQPTWDNTATSSNQNVNELLELFDGVVDWILVAIYVVLGAVLVIKGALLGVQIVKAADEPQVRQEKINSLKWLVIGVAIGYGVTFLADIIIGVITDSLGNSGTAK